MRRLSYCIAYILTKLRKESHVFRFEVYYITQLLLSQVGQILLILIIGVALGIFKYLIVILISFWISKLFIKVWHASSFLSCTVIGVLLLIGASMLASVSNIYSGILLVILFNLYSNTINGKNKLDIISFKIDKINIRIKRRLKNGFR